MKLTDVKLEKYIVESIGSQYTHDTLKVKTLSEYIEIVTELNKGKDKGFKNVLNFRGQSNLDWKLSPVISRLELEKNEKDIIDRFKIDKPDEYNSSMNFIDLLGKMQHFGYPTRLIDFTENPLIALYFACKECHDNDGRVLINENYLDLHYDPPFVNALFEMIDKYSYALYEKEISEFDDFVNSIINLPHLKKDKGIYKYLDIMYNFGKYGIPTVPIRHSKRQKQQKSTFLLFADNIIDPMNGEQIDIELATTKIGWDAKLAKNVFDNSICIPKVLKYKFNSIIIPKKSKNIILKDLELLGIDESTLFPELEYSSGILINNIKNG